MSEAIAGFFAGVVFMIVLAAPISDNLSPEHVATQLCEYLDTGLLEYEVMRLPVEDGYVRVFEYIKCGEPEPEPPLIEGLDSEKLIEVLG